MNDIIEFTIVEGFNCLDDETDKEIYIDELEELLNNLKEEI